MNKSLNPLHPDYITQARGLGTLLELHNMVGWDRTEVYGKLSRFHLHGWHRQADILNMAQLFSGLGVDMTSTYSQK